MQYLRGKMDFESKFLLFLPIISYDGTFLSLRYAQGQA